MGCCFCGYQSRLTEDPAVEFHTEANLLVSAFEKEGIPDDCSLNHPVLLYVKNNRLHHIPRCGDNLLCCMSLCCGYSRQISQLAYVQVISGRVRVLATDGSVMKDWNVELGLKIGIKNWYNPWYVVPCDVVKVYETPDAVRLAQLLQPHVRGEVNTEVVTTDTVFLWWRRRQLFQQLFFCRPCAKCWWWQ